VVDVGAPAAAHMPLHAGHRFEAELVQDTAAVKAFFPAAARRRLRTLRRSCPTCRERPVASAAAVAAKTDHMLAVIRQYAKNGNMLIRPTSCRTLCYGCSSTLPEAAESTLGQSTPSCSVGAARQIPPRCCQLHNGCRFRTPHPRADSGATRECACPGAESTDAARLSHSCRARHCVARA
jgi:hypothetical protein